MKTQSLTRPFVSALLSSLTLLVIACSGETISAEAAPSAKAKAKYTGGSMTDFKKPSDDELRARLTPIQYKVTQAEGTEPPFRNEFWDNHRAGIYVDVVSGEPLFSSLDKFESGTGWPSFTKPLESANIAEKVDKKLFSTRTEVRSAHADSHLGHVFDDGPAPTGLRYCMNSASMRFVPVENLAKEGYEAYVPLFEKEKITDSGKRETATLAGGCFWGMEELIRRLPGVIETNVGYTGGTVPNATYEIVKSGRSGHAESIEIVFDPERNSFEQILDFFFTMHDPTTRNQQGNDIGSQYRSAIFVHDAKQREIATRVREKVDRSGKWKRPVVTEIVEATPFYVAEEYHQDYLQKNPQGYTCHYIRP